MPCPDSKLGREAANLDGGLLSITTLLAQFHKVCLRRTIILAKNGHLSVLKKLGKTIWPKNQLSPLEKILDPRLPKDDIFFCFKPDANKIKIIWNNSSFHTSKSINNPLLNSFPSLNSVYFVPFSDFACSAG